MIMNDLMVNQKFVVEKIDAEDQEKQVLKSIGIENGSELIVVGKGYLEGSVLVICESVLLQLNPYFLRKIHVSNVKEKSR